VVPQIGLVCEGDYFRNIMLLGYYPTCNRHKNCGFEIFKFCAFCYVFWASNLATVGEVILHFVCMFFKYEPLLVLMVFNSNLGKLKNLSIIQIHTISTELLAPCCGMRGCKMKGRKRG
jgi:hypothetical protein